MGKFSLQPGEKLVVNDPHVVWMKMPMVNVAGQLKLTDKRIVFIRDAHPFAVFTLFLAKSMRSAVEFDYPLDKVKTISVVEMGKEKRITIEAGSERPRTFISSKAITMEVEFGKWKMKSNAHA